MVPWPGINSNLLIIVTFADSRCILLVRINRTETASCARGNFEKHFNR